MIGHGPGPSSQGKSLGSTVGKKLHSIRMYVSLRREQRF